jgi:dihydrofolate synthase/folylpolyglutamate synthase
VVKDKSVSQMLSLLPKEADYYFTKAQLPRALAEHDLFEQGVAAGLRGTPYAHAAQALAAAKARATKEDLIVICGSIFLAAEINPLAMNDPSGE